MRKSSNTVWYTVEFKRQQVFLVCVMQLPKEKPEKGGRGEKRRRSLPGSVGMESSFLAEP